MYPVTKKVNQFEAGYSTVVLIAKGSASITAAGHIPIMGGWYRLQLGSGQIVVDVQIHSIIDQESGEELMPVLSQYPEFYSALVELCRNFMTKKFLKR